MDDLLDKPAGRTCKHILAVILCETTQLLPDPPTSVWNLLERLVRAQVTPKAPVAGKMEALALPGCNVRLVRPHRSDGRDILALKVGRVMSGPLVEWKNQIDMRTGQKYGQWALTMQARETYGAWVEALKAN